MDLWYSRIRTRLYKPSRTRGEIAKEPNLMEISIIILDCEMCVPSTRPLAPRRARSTRGNFVLAAYFSNFKKYLENSMRLRSKHRERYVLVEVFVSP